MSSEPTSKLIRQIRAALASATPLIGIQTPDPAATFEAINAILPQKSPVVTWDICRGFKGVNTLGDKSLSAAGVDKPSEYTNPAEAFAIATKFAMDTVLFAYNLHNLLTDPSGFSIQVVQALWNLRDVNKTNGSCLIGFGPEFKLPIDLQQDIIIFDEPLPGDDERQSIIEEQVESAKDRLKGFAAPDADVIRAAVDATRGMSTFMVEQTVAMSLISRRLDVEQLRERTRKIISTQQGLNIFTGSESFATIGGCGNVKDYVGRLLRNSPPGAIIFIDEIEKALAGVSGDTSGVSQEMLGALLTWMQDDNVSGCIFIGPPGCAKSAIAKGAGKEGGIETIEFDISGMKGSLVGESGRNMRNAIKTVRA